MNKSEKQTGAGRRSLFFRLWLRSLTVKRPQAALGLAAILVGAALTAALLNLHDGVRRKMTQEFRAYGANAIVSPPSDTAGAAQVTLAEKDVLSGLTGWKDHTPGAVFVPRLHVVMRLRSVKADERLPSFQNVVAVGTDFRALHGLYPGWRLDSEIPVRAAQAPREDVGAQHAVPLLPPATQVGESDVGARHGVPVRNTEQNSAGAQGFDGGAQHAAPLLPPATQIGESDVGARHGVPLPQGDCVVGRRVAAELHLVAGSEVSLEPAAVPDLSASALRCRISGILSTGAAEDDEVFVPLAALQRVAALEGKLSVVELLIPGETGEVGRAVEELGRSYPSTSVRPVRAIVESQGRVLGKIGGLLVVLTSLIVVIAALCVMATMTAIVLERKKDVAVMKALGATDSLVLRLFLCEGAGLGLLGGLVGFGLGLVLARELGRSLFGVPLSPSWWTLPLISLGSVLVAVLATVFPVRNARAIQPATTLKGV